MQTNLLTSIAALSGLNNCLVCDNPTSKKICSKTCLIKFQYLLLDDSCYLKK